MALGNSPGAPVVQDERLLLPVHLMLTILKRVVKLVLSWILHRI